jgi:fluoride exporter
MSQATTQSPPPSDPAVPRRGHRPAGRRDRLGALAAVAAGGALGAPARYAVALLSPVEPGRFPWATLAVNVTGSLAIGAVLVQVLAPLPPSPPSATKPSG